MNTLTLLLVATMPGADPSRPSSTAGLPAESAILQRDGFRMPDLSPRGPVGPSVDRVPAGTTRKEWSPETARQERDAKALEAMGAFAKEYAKNVDTALGTAKGILAGGPTPIGVFKDLVLDGYGPKPGNYGCKPGGLTCVEDPRGGKAVTAAELRAIEKDRAIHNVAEAVRQTDAQKHSFEKAKRDIASGNPSANACYLDPKAEKARVDKVISDIKSAPTQSGKSANGPAGTGNQNGTGSGAANKSGPSGNTGNKTGPSGNTGNKNGPNTNSGNKTGPNTGDKKIK